MFVAELNREAMSVLRVMPKGFERWFVRRPRRWQLFFLTWHCFLAVAATGAEVPPAGIENLQSEYIVDSWETEQGSPDTSASFPNAW